MIVRLPLGAELTPKVVANAMEMVLARGSRVRPFDDGAEQAIIGAEATVGDARWVMIVKQHDINIDKDVYVLRMLVDDAPNA